MTSLIKFELGKILRNRTVFGGIVVGCLVLLGIFFVGYHYSQLSMSEASNKKKGFEKSLDVIIDEKYSGEFTDEKVKMILSDSMNNFQENEEQKVVNKPFYHYIYNYNSISASHNEENHEFVIRCFEKIKKFIDSSENRERLVPWFDNRLLYVIITTAISGYFNPSNIEPYKDKKRKYKAYLQKKIVQYALKTTNTKGIGKQRKIVLFLIKHHMFFAIDMLGKVRKFQKERRSVSYTHLRAHET